MIKHITKYSTLAATLCMLAVSSSATQANEHEQMMQNMIQMQRCIAETVNTSYLEEMAKNGEKMANEVKQLCKAGQRQQAQDKAMNYAKTMQNDPNFKAMQKCTAQLGSAFPGAQALQEEFALDALNNNHVCDDL